MMRIDLSEIIKKLETLQKRFNASENPTERFAIIEAINHIGMNEIPFKEGNGEWVYKQHYDAMLREQGAHIP